MTAVFIGHGECYGLTKEQIKSEVVKAINSGVTEFLNGGQGSFDWMAASVVHDLKKDYPDIKSYLIIPYLSFSIRDICDLWKLLSTIRIVASSFDRSTTSQRRVSRPASSQARFRL